MFTDQDTTLRYNIGSLTVNGPPSGTNVKALASITYPNGTKQEFLDNG